MNEKMKVWECVGCDYPCIVTNIAGDVKPDNICLYKGEGDPDWHESTRYKIKERKPRYAKMAKLHQFGKFWDDNKDELIYGHLNYYNSPSEHRFGMIGRPICFKHFIPCAEAQELDPITLEPK